MIMADLDQLVRQIPALPRLSAALQFLRQLDRSTLKEGRIDLDGDDLFALPQRYTTEVLNIPLFEYHRRYIDVQFVVEGEEYIYWAPTSSLTVTDPFDQAKDVCLGNIPSGSWTALHLTAGRAAIMFPDDAHAPRQAVQNIATVFKIVVKVAI